MFPSVQINCYFHALERAIKMYWNIKIIPQIVKISVVFHLTSIESIKVYSPSQS